MPSPLSLQARAKVNLHLDIGPRQPDGYHSLRTLFQEISLYDRLEFSPMPEQIRLTIEPAGVLPLDSNNLIVRALENLKAKMGFQKGLRVKLYKRIPMGAGLGGGSSDAAAALWGGWMVWTGLKDKPARVPATLMECAKPLGADVPFFLKGGLAWAEGIGDQLMSLPTMPRRWLVVAYPNAHVPTKEAYRWLDEYREKHPDALEKEKAAGHRPLLGFHPQTPVPLERFFNSFEKIIFERFPPVQQAKSMLERLGAQNVMMSGSGSTVFGFVKNRKAGEEIQSRMQRGGWNVFVEHTV